MDQVQLARVQGRGAQIAGVRPDGIAAALGLAPGDRVLEIDGRALRDILDYHFLTQAEQMVLRVVRPNGQELVIEVEKDEDEPLGITLADEIFDGVRECGNNCLFCFVSQLPPGMREPLYVRDDDYRLSVLDGNFVTLTNLRDSDWRRLAEQRLSPLHVSIHSTDDELRRWLLGNPAAPPLLPQLRRLLEMGLQVHGQIVLCPGINDGPALERTLADLLALEPGLASLAVVPVGVTRHKPAQVRPYGAAGAKAVLSQLRQWQRHAAGADRLYAADEWYLLAGARLPGYLAYGEFPQLANGVGMAKQFQRELQKATRRLPSALPRPRRVAMVTGKLFAPVLTELVGRRLAEVGGLSCEVIACSNELFGNSVTVAGLLGGQDVIDGAVPWRGAVDTYILPAELFRAAGDVTLDGLSAEDLGQALGAEVAVVHGPREMVQAALGQMGRAEHRNRGDG